MNKVELNKAFKFLIEDFSFGTLSQERLVNIGRDGRVASHLLEPQLEDWFPELTHVAGCKGYDHYDQTGQLYDAKNFTKNGLKFMPSNQIGSGRKFCFETTKEHASDLIYICCDIVEFPEIRVVFKDGKDLLEEYPNGMVSKGQREDLFSG